MFVFEDLFGVRISGFLQFGGCLNEPRSKPG